MVKLGIIGGGQLGLMLCISVIKNKKLNSNIEIIYIYSNKKDIPCNILLSNKVVEIQIVIGDFSNEDMFLDFCNKCDIVTYEFENININLLKNAEINNKIKHNSINAPNLIYPNIKYLEIIQDKLKQKEFLQENGFNVAPFQYIKNYEDIYYFIERYDYPVIIKSRRGSFDGRGNFYISNYEELTKWYCTISSSTKKIHEFYIENIIDFDNEFSITGCNSSDNFKAIFDPVKNIHKNNILLKTKYSKNIISEYMSNKIKNIHKKILDLFDTKGVICIEFFHKGKYVYINEIALRVHNSYHISINCCNVSQFEAHIRCIINEQISNIKMDKYSGMVNIISKMPKDRTEGLSEISGFHDYGKLERENRKLGHITLVDTNKNNLLKKIQNIKKII